MAGRTQCTAVKTSTSSTAAAAACLLTHNHWRLLLLLHWLMMMPMLLLLLMSSKWSAGTSTAVHSQDWRTIYRRLGWRLVKGCCCCCCCCLKAETILQCLLNVTAPPPPPVLVKQHLDKKGSKGERERKRERGLIVSECHGPQDGARLPVH